MKKLMMSLICLMMVVPAWANYSVQLQELKMETTLRGQTKKTAIFNNIELPVIKKEAILLSKNFGVIEGKWEGNNETQADAVEFMKQRMNKFFCHKTINDWTSIHPSFDIEGTDIRSFLENNGMELNVRPQMILFKLKIKNVKEDITVEKSSYIRCS
jgi:hypothetical protein